MYYYTKENVFRLSGISTMEKKSNFIPPIFPADNYHAITHSNLSRTYNYNITMSSSTDGMLI